MGGGGDSQKITTSTRAKAQQLNKPEVGTLLLKPSWRQSCDQPQFNRIKVGNWRMETLIRFPGRDIEPKGRGKKTTNMSGPGRGGGGGWAKKKV